MAITYRSSGVDIDAADGWLARMRPLIRSTRSPRVLADRGQFGGLFSLAGLGMREPVLVASTDGAGTKLKLAQLVNRHEGIGIDVVAMNTNDVLVYGATPLFFLDYLAVGKIRRSLMSALLRGIVRGCRESGCALLGGETAEMPGVYRSGEYDAAGFCVGVVERERLIDGSRVRAGDAVVGLASSGVHANGFSLVRKVFSAAELRRHARTLLAPTRIYVKPVLSALRTVSIGAIAHVTGGGLARRLPSLVAARPGLTVRVQPGSWSAPAIFRDIQHAGRISDEEMARTFNMGIGMALVCRPGDQARLIAIMRRAEVPAWPIGTIERN
ncbi:MAG: phosphoribosylformylglycinamidine cyclo-ligase [Omnitrophica WOR_2 bacterium RIFCSPHIGHO2_02_FULL_67_20]|nr:MAG: phosphoribosylformylglycinamidine cyclo-ligase [Omnitrophica WOR_2 bacterium RIFCSPHIGHO2_02_FULL_67_20]